MIMYDQDLLLMVHNQINQVNKDPRKQKFNHY